MSIEALWYSHYAMNDGQRPKCKRICRRPFDEQQQFTIDLAIDFAGGRAGYRPTRSSVTGEEYWHLPSGWWMVPYRIAKRCHVLYDAAVRTELHRGRGMANQEDIERRLVIWRRTGKWKSIAFAVLPRRAEPLPKKRGRPRKKP